MELSILDASEEATCFLNKSSSLLSLLPVKEIRACYIKWGKVSYRIFLSENEIE